MMRPLRPHRYWGGTTCPGDPWREWVPGLREFTEEDEMTDAEFVAQWERLVGQKKIKVGHSALFDIIYGLQVYMQSKEFLARFNTAIGADGGAVFGRTSLNEILLALQVHAEHEAVSVLLASIEALRQADKAHAGTSHAKRVHNHRYSGSTSDN